MSARRHFAIAAVVWVALSAVGIALVAGIRILPVIASREAVIVDQAFVLLTAASIPVLMLVVVALGYSALRFRAADGEDGDAAPIRGHRTFEASWVAITLVAVLALAAYGTLGLLDIRGSSEADLDVNVMATQWKWSYEYPGVGAKSKELVLPVDRRIRLHLSSDDVIHSFYVPAFGIKHDVVPGRVSEIYLTITQTGVYGSQCAELCGLGHTVMTDSVRVLPGSEFDAWLAAQPKQKGG